MTLVDTNVLLDVFTKDPKWLGWSVMQLEEASIRGPLLINDVIYSETSSRYSRVEDFETALVDAGVTVVPTPRVALFSRARHSCNIEARAAFASACSPIFLSAPMRRSNDCRC